MKRISVTLLCLLLAATSILTTSCTVRILAKELSAGYVRKADDPGEMTAEFLTSTLDFSLNLFRQTVTDDGRNDLFSPYSALLCLGLIANGTAGDTRSELESDLRVSVKTLNRGLYALHKSLASTKDCKINAANSAWYIDDESRLSVKPAFLQSIADWYEAEQYATPFDATTLKDINAWGNDKTNGLIPEFLNEIPPDAVMYLVNALLFDAKWATPYERKDIRDWSFQNTDGSESPVKMLCSEESLYLSGEGFDGFAKLYKGGKYAFVGLLPEEGLGGDGLDVYALLNTLDAEAWQTMWKSRGGTVHVKLPEFQYEGDLRLKNALIEMGIRQMFEPGADFSALGTSQDGNGFFCSAINQKTYIEVDRNGTKAAAITWGELKAGSAAPEEPRYVTLDRPFLYAIIDCETGFPLFLGVVTNL